MSWNGNRNGLLVFVEKVKSFPSNFDHRTDVISDNVALSQAPAEAAKPWTRGQCVPRCACLLPILRRYQITLLGDRGKCVWTTCPRSHPTGPQSPIASLTPKPLWSVVYVTYIIIAKLVGRPEGQSENRDLLQMNKNFNKNKTIHTPVQNNLLCWFSRFNDIPPLQAVELLTQ